MHLFVNLIIRGLQLQKSPERPSGPLTRQAASKKGQQSTGVPSSSASSGTSDTVLKHPLGGPGDDDKNGGKSTEVTMN